MDFYDLSYTTVQGKVVPFSDHKGETILIVNTATKCGLAPQFKELEFLHQKYKNKGLTIIGFPCNQFLGQEPESNESMAEACEINFGVSFQLTQKVNVNGSSTDPVFKYLKDQKGGFLSSRIKWNFTKFLINSNGKVVERYSPKTSPKSIEKDIEGLLSYQ